MGFLDGIRMSESDSAREISFWPRQLALEAISLSQQKVAHIRFQFWVYLYSFHG